MLAHPARRSDGSDISEFLIHVLQWLSMRSFSKIILSGILSKYLMVHIYIR